MCEKIEKSSDVIKVEEKSNEKNGQCDQEEKVEEVKKVKEEVKEVIRPRSNSKIAGLLLSPVANGGRKRKRFGLPGVSRNMTPGRRPLSPTKTGAIFQALSYSLRMGDVFLKKFVG